jgi:hypothetical protein
MTTPTLNYYHKPQQLVPTVRASAKIQFVEHDGFNQHMSKICLQEEWTRLLLSSNLRILSNCYRGEISNLPPTLLFSLNLTDPEIDLDHWDVGFHSLHHQQDRGAVG